PNFVVTTRPATLAGPVSAAIPITAPASPSLSSASDTAQVSSAASRTVKRSIEQTLDAVENGGCIALHEHVGREVLVPERVTRWSGCRIRKRDEPVLVHDFARLRHLHIDGQ